MTSLREALLLPADLPGWSMGGGVSGPNVEQIRCPECWDRAVGGESDGE